MGDMSAHFSRAEFACHCGCGFGLRVGQVSTPLVVLLERIRDHFDTPVMVVSGCRCGDHNRRVGGATGSQHLHGTAADIKVQGVPPTTVARWVDEQHPKRLGIGRYRTWTHVDVRDGRARWGSV